ncbi:MurR/RpiR family transcriptional regulator [Parapusillimonas granuli]|uniref:MurR/RpiR family transcriptional regulator n=1 Tax=Parapusillimonas granuli TaxID=380911 RepID=A0A853G2V6_9BURK|nr:MurR/RpiR family transcriptional regulator [Parapusillimonas granuli]MBB5214521.1 DNA-binding MurR/RpiR family transcriptional regulator [Parapusillimonas granuli]NYT49071.1 MurR/RpiR family transcriptional regulator [Parapusillimonas granuli]
MDKLAVDRLIKERFDQLSPTLQRAARYAIDNPRAIALNSMRTVASDAGLQASAMHRLARQLGFEGYEELRSAYRGWLAQGGGSFTERATALQQHGGDGSERLLAELVAADTDNLRKMTAPDTLKALGAARDLLAQARHIYAVGLRSLFPAAFYFNYACGMFMRNITLLSGVGGIFADELRRSRREDALIIFSYEPYARDSVAAVRFARERGLKVVAVTDSVVSPIAPHADALIVVANATPSLFPSVVPALSVAQMLVALLVADGGAASLEEIKKSEAQLRDFNVYLE